ncbi:MAG TPA: G1 family glutamic endopeptidase, partial [Acidimicrobiales bacterium]|nr:G1 family glutamic endopeptidase [Acidimicrobiales bacterium]
TGAGSWTVVLKDTTTGMSASRTDIAHSGPDASAEWIMEDPSLSVNGRGSHLAALADYGAIAFDSGTVNGTSPNLVANSSHSDAGLMAQHAHVVSVPSGPDGDTAPDGFAVAHGVTPPPAPNS